MIIIALIYRFLFEGSSTRFTIITPYRQDRDTYKHSSNLSKNIQKYSLQRTVYFVGNMSIFQNMPPSVATNQNLIHKSTSSV